MHRIFTITSCILLLLGAAGCINEDTSDCPRTVLTFYYDADGDRNVVGDYIHGASLYVFDQDKLVVRRSVSASELVSDKGISIMLPAGDYNVVCWGNVSRYSQEVINGGHEQCLLQHSTITASGRIETFDPLYYAFAEITLTDRNTASCVLDFRCAHIDLDFYVRGFCERFTGASHPEIRIRNIETCYDFAMHAYRTSDVVCFPIVRSDATPQVHTAQMSILRTDEQTPMAICIHIPDGDEVFSLKMADLLHGDAAVRTAPISLDREEIRIPISVDFTGNSVDVTVEVPDWVEEPIRPGI